MQKDNLIAFVIFIISTIAFVIWGFGYISQHQLILFILASIFGIFMAFNIGGNDVANSFGTSVGAKTVTIKQALIIAAVFELSGAIFAGAEVTKTIRSGIVIFPNSLDPMLFVIIMLAALLSSGVWIFIATKKGLPVSTTHSIVGGIVGASIMMGLLKFDGIQTLSMVKWSEILRIAISWIASPLLGGIVAYIIYSYIDKKILKPSEKLNDDLKNIKKERKKFKEEYFLNLKTKSQEEQIKELSAIALDEEEQENNFYRNKMKEFKDQEKDIDIYSILKTHMPIIACIAAAIISAMFLFKGLNNVSTLDILQNFWIIGIIGTISYVVTFAIVKIVKKTELNKTTDRIFSWFQIFTASSFAFSHGANDIANAIGPFAAILDVLKNGTINATSPVPFAALAMFGVALVVGLWFLGKEVITTVGSKLATIRPTTGFSAELGASIVILLATQFGIPVSSTHILIGAILGIGVYNKNANWIMMKPIGLAWIITLPAAGIMAALVFLGFKLSLGI
ncbi:inorganic phosphate transporter [Campylobacter jejuni]|uniref:Phosphate transporter n=5 Tax=Campylobacter jejuni TaxID=197 RepID=Q0P962_CAMJE|nr:MULTISPECIES: inorganic phosphate transporter [Campylobacter]YP_002344585.1 phosphate permease [Campylobacter jejuni subsp. jejuni NCTC 11168 = ATCC 700819]EAI9977368.1 inorganic phosphate transporter [Campylobacter coli]EFV06598.1 phosphate transporter family protein [Campylobacter jejuni subsp. jejuni DFVF1099]KQI62769.1 phosphate permease [Campylobacter jejuni CVM 41905]ABV52737.1 possible phosphate permease [Campylobacter jejuni subsp. jejuni 81116]ADN91370.1 Possible phosphate permeas